MRAGSSYIATAVALGIITLTGCSSSDKSDGAPAPGEDWGDENKYPGIGGAFQNLDPLNNDQSGTNPGCVFASGIVTVTSTISQTIVVGKRAIDSVILVNDLPCSTTATPSVPAVQANATTMKRLVVVGSAQNESLVLDFLGGFFSPGVATASAGAIAVDMGAGTDIVNIRATSAADSLFLGSDGLAFNADNYKDITFAGTESLNIALAGGADTLTATNATPTKGVTGATTIPLTIFGGSGNDVLLGGANTDVIYGGPGNDTISGGAGVDTMYGEDGLDTMQGTATADGSDVIDCGDEATNTSIDVVSYSLRTNVITATMGTPGGAGDGGADSGSDGGLDGGAGGTPGTAGESGESDSIANNCEGITGGTGNDILNGNSNDNVLSGGPGDDVITGNDGNDTLNGNDGADRFVEGSASNGGDIFNGGAGIDTIDYSARTATLTVTMDGTAADDGLDSEGDNVKADVENILGGSGNDTITGNTAANVITGGLGDDTLNGGAGDDTFIEYVSPAAGANAGAIAAAAALGTGADVISGGLNTDLVDYSGRSGALTITMDDGLNNDGQGSGGSAEHDNIGDDVENLNGGAGADNITGNDLNNKINGGLGNDTISGGDGDDTLDGTDHGVGVANIITCGDGSDAAYDCGLAGSYADDCETKGVIN